MEKSEIRTLAIKQRSELTDEQVAQKSSAIAKLLIHLPEYKEAKSALFYYAHNREVDTHHLMEDWMLSKELYLPKLEEENSFKALRCSNLASLVPNKYGIPEPADTTEAEHLDLIIVPGVAFDKLGNRIGMGKGYYDRFLSGQKKAFKIALAYGTQILASLPKEPYDESVDMIVTEERVIRCR